MNCVLSSVRRTAASISALMLEYCAFKSMNGITKLSPLVPMPDVDGNRGPLRIHGKARRFQNLHNAQPAHSIRKRAIASVNAANEFSGFPGQRFLRVQMWRPCVAGTVADPSLILLSRVP